MPDIDMTVTADDQTPLAGTLTLPVGSGPHPAVLLLHGSGPLDREGNTRKVRMNLGRPLAAALAAEGVAVLRYDRRGAGATPGAWRATGFTDNYEDAAAALRALADHPTVRPDAVGVIGHSEGALHAMSLAARHDVGAAVLLAGYARPGEEALRWQARSLVQGMPAPVRLLRRPLGALGERVLARIKKTRTDVARIAVPVNARWMRENLAHDSRDDLIAIHAPVLAVTGDKDLQVDPADLDEMCRLVPGGAEIHRVPDLTHVLRRDPGRHTLRSYRRLLRDPVDPDLLNLITTWLARQLGVVPGRMRAEGRTFSS
ncbi:alpha/beta hydrolase family protein [Streptomyces malaysiensis]|uniref:Alpha/beta hydrolase n=1 Tax=Streptomyces malaysiensis subsp. samsunensis TaxID=459658 RepID=A0A9X2M4A4_STRMQ|nr:alpha/beta hydrolase [Streptomyces samsunensis]MCQ8835381.1 alpha/beta hydrolase [Streptomyces samsunensis]